MGPNSTKLLQENLILASKDLGVRLALKSSVADELHATWYRESFLSKVLSADSIDVVSTKVLTWCKQTLHDTSFNDLSVEGFKELTHNLQASVFAADEDLLVALSDFTQIERPSKDNFGTRVLEVLNEPYESSGGFGFVLINTPGWTAIAGSEEFANEIDLVPSQELLRIGTLGRYGRTHIFTDGMRPPGHRVLIGEKAQIFYVPSPVALNRGPSLEIISEVKDTAKPPLMKLRNLKLWANDIGLCKVFIESEPEVATHE